MYKKFQYLEFFVRINVVTAFDITRASNSLHGLITTKSKFTMLLHMVITIVMMTVQISDQINICLANFILIRPM